ncbi:MAG: hypothetical protein FDZ75_08410, partial [Actinobacteria bacterium]
MTHAAHIPRLVLAPASTRGWFGGLALVADVARDVRAGVTLPDAAAELEAAFDGTGVPLVAVLAAYDGTCTV